jgi:hypothetical protein
MANTVTENINKVVQAKNELKSLLQYLGMEPTDEFRTYSYMFVQKLEELEEKADDVNGI